jgi:hypothetical protein
MKLLNMSCRKWDMLTTLEKKGIRQKAQPRKGGKMRNEECCFCRTASDKMAARNESKNFTISA